jgi:hypothetical protein
MRRGVKGKEIGYERSEFYMNNRFPWLFMLFALFLIARSPVSAFAVERGQPAIAAKSDNYQMLKLVFSGAAMEGSSSSFQSTATVGETVTGPISSPSYQMSQGFWDDLGDNYICGDANGDGSVDISDAVYLIAYIFSGGGAPNPLLAGDANCDAAVDISDVVYLIAYIFSGGQAPCATCK